MKFPTLAAMALLLAGAGAASAQSTEIPAMKCEKPTMPGQKMMEDPGIRRRIEREMKTYGDCVKAYVAERQAAAKAHQEAAQAQANAGNTAVVEYNAFVKQQNEAAGGK
ncbi:MAG TPA: hypothetical protein VM122_07160 [Usitatibacter sp.]|nr:hypothetical protein [Usitatibacter sp.]